MNGLTSIVQFTCGANQITNLITWMGGQQRVKRFDYTSTNGFSQQTKVTSNGVVVLKNWYDASGRRVAKSERVGGAIQRGLYLSDGWEIVAVMNKAGQLRETFTRGIGLAGDIGTLVAVTHHAGSSTNGVFYCQHNHRGDIVLTRAGTATVGRYDYAAFGAVKSQIGPDVSRFTFSSKERDGSTGFSYYGYRFYAPQWQRWANPDVVRETGGWNLYRFVGNSPCAAIDPVGLRKSSSCVQDCRDAFGDPLANIAAGTLVGFLWDVLREVFGDEGLVTDGGKIKQMCRGGKLTKFGRFLRSASLWGLVISASHELPDAYGLATCIALCPDVSCPPPGTYYNDCFGVNGPPTTIVLPR